MKRIEVVPVGRWGWLVYWSESGDYFRTKPQALRFARRMARYQNTSVVVHKMNGRFQEERTYPRSADPKRSRG